MVRLLRPALSWLAVLGLDGSSSSFSLRRGSWSRTKSKKCSTLLFAKASVLLQCANTFQNASLYNSQRLAQCNVRVRTRQLGASPNPHFSDRAACGPVERWLQCGAGRCVMLRAVKRLALCSTGRCVALGAVWRWAQCSAGRSVALYMRCAESKC